MYELGILYLGCTLLDAMEMPFKVDKCLECLGLVDKFSLGLKKDSEICFCNDVVLNRLAVRTDAIEAVNDETEHLAELEYNHLGGGEAGKVISTLLKYKIAGKDVEKPLRNLTRSDSFIQYISYWTEINSIPTFSEVFALWQEKPIVLHYISYEVKKELQKKCDDIFRRFRMELLSVVCLKHLVNNVFSSFCSGTTKEQVVKDINNKLDMFKKYDVRVNDLQYVAWAVMQCYGGDSCAEED